MVSPSCALLPSGRIDRVRSGLQLSAAAHKDLWFWMADDLKAGAAEQRFRASPIRDPPVGGVARVLLFNEVQTWETGPVKDLRFREGIVVRDRFHLVATALQGLKHQQIFGDVLVDQIECQQRMAEMIEYPHEQDQIELLPQLSHIVHRELSELDINPDGLSRKTCLRQIGGIVAGAV